MRKSTLYVRVARGDALESVPVTERSLWARPALPLSFAEHALKASEIENMAESDEKANGPPLAPQDTVTRRQLEVSGGKGIRVAARCRDDRQVSARAARQTGANGVQVRLFGPQIWRQGRDGRLAVMRRLGG